MLDLVQEEEVVARAAGMPFEDLLLLVDSVSPAALGSAYEEATDRYMVLAGKGTRSSSENLELDRLDSALRMVLGDSGLLAFAARLVMVLSSARKGIASFRSNQANAKDLADVRFSLRSAAALCREEFRRTPIPVDSSGMAEKFVRASEAARVLAEVQTTTRWWAMIFDAERSAQRSAALLADELTAVEAGSNSWEMAKSLLDPLAVKPRERTERVRLCFQISGLAACWQIIQDALDGFRNAAELVKGGLGA